MQQRTAIDGSRRAALSRSRSRVLALTGSALLLGAACSGVGGIAGAASKSKQPAPKQTAPKGSLATVGPGTIGIDCAVNRKPINPLIYGIALNAISDQRDTQQYSIGATARRWGGNPTSRYNWQIDAWNTAQDYFWRNVSVFSGGSSWQRFLDANRKNQMQSALTVPTLGWVAKDTSSYSFPVKVFGQQKYTDPDIPDAGNGSTPDDKKVTPGSPDRTSIRSTPDFVAKWMAAVKAAAPAGQNPLDMVILDNEPDLWNETHRDVHPDPAGYDEILQKTIDYGSAVRAVLPQAKIAGPASWGWWGYFYSAKDNAGGFSSKPDRRAHGDLPFLQWYLRQLKAYEKKTGIKPLDVLDVHFYPQGNGIYDGGAADADPATAALRIRSTRGLWDPTYKDESWIGEPVDLLPRLQQLVDQEYPGLGISIGEYNFYGENHISGAIAQAEALGRFGQAGITSAFLWTYPAANSPQYWGFRAFRNYDGQGGHFLDQSIGARSGDAQVTAFASTDAFSRQVVAVLINQSASAAVTSKLSIRSCAPLGTLQQWSYAGGTAGFTAGKPVAVTGGSASVTLAPWSVNVVRLDA